MSDIKISPKENSIDSFDLFDFIMTEIRCENDAINSRLQALLGSQSFLVIAYATALTGFYRDGATNLTILIPCLFCLLGFMLAVMALAGIRAGYAAISKWEGRQRELIAQNAIFGKLTLFSNEDEAYDTERRSQRGSIFTHKAPLLFMFAWTVFFSIPAILFAFNYLDGPNFR